MTQRKQEEFLVLRAQSGDREALDALLKTVQAPLFRYICGLVNDRDMARDVLQEVFIEIYRNLRWLREPSLCRSWAYRIASRKAFKRLKREQHWLDQVRDDEVLNSVPADSTEQNYMAEYIEFLPELVSNLSPACRAVLVLHYLEEMPLNEVADVLGIAVGTVKSRLAYGLARLREILGDRAEESRLGRI